MSYVEKKENMKGGILYKKRKVNVGQEAMWHIPKMQWARALRAAVWTLLSLVPLAIVALFDFVSHVLGLGIELFGFWQILIYATPLMMVLAFVKSFLEMQGKEKLFFILTFSVSVAFSVLTLGLFLGFAFYIYMQLVLYFEKHINEEAAHLSLRSLKKNLEDWKCFPPKQSDLIDCSRVLLSPENKYFLLCIVQGVLEEEYIEQYVKSEGPDIDALSKVESTTHFDQRVLWVVKPEGLRENQAVKKRGDVVKVVFDYEEMARQMESWNRAFHDQEHVDSKSEEISKYDLKVKGEVIQELEELLSDTWKIRRNVVLANDGNVDVVVISPSKRVFVIDIQVRQDQMNLEISEEDRAKSWVEIYSQVRLAASQFQATGIVWQPKTSEQNMKRIKEIYSVRGNASTLFLSLERISQDLEEDQMVS